VHDVLVKSGFADLDFYSRRLSCIWLGMCWVWLAGANTPRIILFAEKIKINQALLTNHNLASTFMLIII
jgi:hypothetical protein